MNTALLVIDIQNDYFANGAAPLINPDKAAANAARILEYSRKQQQLCIHIQHIANRPGATFFVPGTAGAEIHQAVMPLAGEKLFTKHYPNSFRETGLLQYLHSQQITDLVICGMMTHMCIDATTRAAKDYGFNCTVIGDACATKDLDINETAVKAGDVQTAFLAALNYFYASVINTNDYLK
ncbi:cysteine hydrolase family protein [Filimonas effusa]|uniref:Cysteine hydrolase n=1 Tax=Filimonas effusa TaxID=2508721 RepID=A0A4Q1DDY0_9BACT|nr:cysteine hydrolase family protein [Filimonas effusa]RXK86893.1 cysteine hydrolase [Filimonas effusa]